MTEMIVLLSFEIVVLLYDTYIINMTEIVKKGNPNWVTGLSGNPNGKPKGAISKRNEQWYALRDSITGLHTEEFNNALAMLWRSDPMLAMRMYLEVLNYFKPKHAAVSNYSGDDALQGLVLSIEGFTIPELPSNSDPDDNL